MKRNKTCLHHSPAPEARGFTLIEVLVVVAIIALLVSILLPSLSRAREQSKSLVCQTHLKELGNAIHMYLTEYKETLPGPMHPAMLKDTKNTNDFQKVFYLPAMLRKYFETRRGSGSMTDAVSTCPGFPVEDSKFMSIWGTGPNPFHYSMNSWTNTRVPGAPGSSVVDMNYYFGFTHAGIKDYGEWYKTYCNTPDRCFNYSPKKMNRIKQPAKDYAMADAFQRPRADELAGASNLPRGSWPREDKSDGNSGNALPRSPFHLGTGYEERSGGWVYRGRTNTLFLDMHVESQRGFGRFLTHRDEF